MNKYLRDKKNYLLILVLLTGFSLIIKTKFFSSEKKETVRDSEYPEKIQLSPEVIENSKIKIITIKKENIIQTITLVGEVAFDPDRVSQLSARIPGRISRVDFVEGSVVRQGQALVEMESPDASRLRSKFLASYNKTMVAERNMKRLKELSALRLVSDQEVLNAEGDFRVLDSELKMDRTNLQVQGIPIPEIDSKTELGLGKILIRSPLNGIALSRDAIPGKQVDTGTVLGVVGDITRVWFLIKIFEKDLSLLQSNTDAKIILNALPELEFSGKLEHIGNQVDQGTRTLSGRIVLQNPDLKAKVGLFGKAEISVSKKDAIAIPTGSVFDRDEKKYVFVQSANYTFIPRVIIIGESSNGKIEVLKGLEEGEGIVSEGLFTLKSIFLKATFGEE